VRHGAHDAWGRACPVLFSRYLAGVRSELRTFIFGVVIVLILAVLIFEPPGTLAAVGYAVVLVTMVLSIVRERRAKR